MDGYKRRIEQQDYMNWLNGQYTMSALTVAISNCFSKNSNLKYIEKPIMQMVSEQNRPLTEEEKQLEVDRFFAQEKARRVNWKRNHKKENKDSVVS